MGKNKQQKKLLECGKCNVLIPTHKIWLKIVFFLNIVYIPNLRWHDIDWCLQTSQFKSTIYFKWD